MAFILEILCTDRDFAQAQTAQGEAPVLDHPINVLLPELVAAQVGFLQHADNLKV